MNKPVTDSDLADFIQDGAATDVPFRRRPLHVAVLSRRRFQLLFGLLFAVVFPALIRWPGGLAFTFQTNSFNNSVLGATVALVWGYFLVRRLTVFPGLQIFSFVLPSFVITYGVVVATLFFIREEYSRFHLISSFAISVVFYYYAFLVERRIKRPRIAVIAGGHTTDLMKYDRVDWLVLRSPGRLPRKCDGLVADLRAKMGDGWEAFIARCALRGTPVYHSKQLQESLTGQVSIEHLSENTLGSLIPSLIYARTKFVGDLLLAVLLAPFVAIICGIAAILIKIEDGGPILFVQDRVGYRGRVFRVYKLRTMRQDSEGEHFTKEKDPRVTRIGAFLRRFRIDELPQILNIFKGEMSWIGPRPEAQKLSHWYEREIPFYSYRHIVRPGISGWAQVHQGNVARPEKVRYKLHYDFYYIKNFSLWLDLVIFAQTLRIIVTGFGAR